MLEAIRHCLVVLVALVVIGGQSRQLAHASDVGMAMAGMPCSMSMPTQAAGDHAKPMTPCKGMTGDCMKQLGCVADIALPARFSAGGWTMHHTPIAYWQAGSGLRGQVRQPDPFPPRTI